MSNKIFKKLSDDIKLILMKHSGLAVAYNNGLPTKIYGNYKVQDDNMITIGDFDIEVYIPVSYPFAFPVLIETSNKILPRCADRHIDSNGMACLEFTHKRILAARKGMSLTYFFENYVHKYFCWQLLYEIEGNKNLEEWPHGDMAVFLFYSELLNTKDVEGIKLIIKAALERKKLSRNESCICGATKKFKRCHIVAYDTISSFEKSRLSDDLRALNTIANDVG